MRCGSATERGQGQSRRTWPGGVPVVAAAASPRRAGKGRLRRGARARVKPWSISIILTTTRADTHAARLVPSARHFASTLTTSTPPGGGRSHSTSRPSPPLHDLTPAAMLGGGARRASALLARPERRRSSSPTAYAGGAGAWAGGKTPGPRPSVVRIPLPNQGGATCSALPFAFSPARGEASCFGASLAAWRVVIGRGQPGSLVRLRAARRSRPSTRPAPCSDWRGRRPGSTASPGRRPAPRRGGRDLPVRIGFPSGTDHLIAAPTSRRPA